MPKENAPSWDIDAIADALQAETESCYHPQDGKGTRFKVGMTYTYLDAWPRIGHLYVHSSSLRMDLYRMNELAIDEASVLWTGGKPGDYRHLWVSANGNVTLTYPGVIDRSYERRTIPLR